PPPPPQYTHNPYPSPLPGLFEHILDELTRPKSGGAHIVMGCVERLLSLLPLDYKVSVEWNDRKSEENRLFEKTRFLLEDCYEDVSMADLIAAFGHNKDYFNHMIKRHTGMTYSAFLQNIRLEKAELLLQSTEFPVEQIARKVGYENLSYFYRIFTRKFAMKPDEMRRSHKPAES
ncbi:MAG: AraC family transcriptional regulator, partial [Treponema sp.]|nr:AraC family transcriptional regulator [Treponema sp.]